MTVTHVRILTAINQSINMRLCVTQNKQSKMSSNALSVSALEHASFHLFAESVNRSQFRDAA